MMGRLYIPEAGINVAVYDCTGQTLEEKQKIVDDEDSAAYFKVGDVNLLADHNYQGFYKIQYAVPEKTAAFIQHGTTIDMYVCIENGVGINNKKRLIDANQNIIFSDNLLSRTNLITA